MPIELPAASILLDPCRLPQHGALLTTGSIFLVDGSLDIPISPPTQPSSATGLQSIAAFYGAVPAGTVKVKGTLIGPTHCDVQGVPQLYHHYRALFPRCLWLSGLPTAWMMFQLQGDSLGSRCVRQRQRRDVFRIQKLATGGQQRSLGGHREPGLAHTTDNLLCCKSDWS